MLCRHFVGILAMMGRRSTAVDRRIAFRFSYGMVLKSTSWYRAKRPPQNPITSGRGFESSRSCWGRLDGLLSSVSALFLISPTNAYIASISDRCRSKKSEACLSGMMRLRCSVTGGRSRLVSQSSLSGKKSPDPSPGRYILDRIAPGQIGTY